MSTEPRALALATALPETPPKTTEATTVVENGTDQTSEVAACYTVAPSSPVQADGSLELHLALATTMCTTTNSFTSCTGEVILYSVRLTLTAV